MIEALKLLYQKENFILGLVCYVDAFTMGAPDAACKHMTPGHAQQPQVSS